ncbi:MAG TPA: hypothetical protein VF759_06180 [Allosphingosinicella sp.]|jgi:hypothetical protein
MGEPSQEGGGAIPANPALKPFEFLIGQWRTTGKHPEIPGETLHGRSSFAWDEDGAFLVVRTHVDHPQIPDSVAFIASDDVAGKFVMAYFDRRGVSRIFDVAAGDGVVTWRRDNPQFAQSMTIRADGDELFGEGRMSIKGGAWVDDLSQVYARA